MKLSKLDAIGKPYAIYADALDGNTIEQFTTAMQHEAVVQGALMPDAHSGYSLPIGGVVLCKDMVFPSFVGYDIGCGVTTQKTGFSLEAVQKNAAAIFEALCEAIPTGVGKHHETRKPRYGDQTLLETPRTAMLDNHFQSLGILQLSTLGSGNHFIELGGTESGEVFATVHSGSRNLGHHVATHYMKLAASSDKAKEGAFGLYAHSEEGINYLKDMKFCEAYAHRNRHLLLVDVLMVTSRVLGDYSNFGYPIVDDLYINKAHNFIETKPGNLFLHRKGATVADRHTLGVIPGNMRDGVYVVEGLGNTESMDSCSHGAGRTMSRAKAKDTIAMEEFTETMQGITAKVTEGTKDESPFAYKDFARVMELQKDLAKIKFHIKPIINVKG